MATEETINEVRKVLDSLDIYCGDCKYGVPMPIIDEDGEEWNPCEDCHRKMMNFKPATDKIIEARYGK